MSGQLLEVQFPALAQTAAHQGNGNANPQPPSLSQGACQPVSVRSGSSHRLMVQPDAGISPLLRALYAAKRRIFVKAFAMEDETLIGAIIDAHRRGVDCRVQLNEYRTDGSNRNAVTMEALTRAGVPARWTNPQHSVTHEKSMVIDDEGYICTFNFNRKFFERVRGYAVITEDPSEVDEIVACFAADWDRRSFPSVGRLAWGGPASRNQIAQLIDSAQRTLDIQHKQLGDAGLLSHLLMALARGVKVRYLGSGQKGVREEDLYEHAASLRILRQAGAKIHKVKSLKVHSKLIIVDGRVAHVGSMNLTRMTFEQRREISIVVRDAANLSELRRVFDRDWNDSKSWQAPDPLQLRMEPCAPQAPAAPAIRRELCAAL